MKKKIYPKKQIVGILTGGGDCAGLNPAIKWAVKGLLDEDLSTKFKKYFEVIGILRGWGGLVDVDTKKTFDEKNLVKLDDKNVRTFDRDGGTRLMSSRTNPFKSRETAEKTLQNIKKLGLHAIIAIGGEDTLSVAANLKKEKINVAAIPKTIDKDLAGTDYSLGFETSVQIICEEIDRLRTTAGSHSRVFVVETMGRHAGHLALQGGIAGGACMILIPEVEFEMEKVIEILNKRQHSGARYDIVVVAEGAKLKGQQEIIYDMTLDDFGHRRLGGIGNYIAAELEKNGFKESRAVVLSHLQRGGAPVAYDRIMGRAFGLAAAELVMQDKFGQMVSLRNGEIIHIAIEDAIKKDKHCRTILNKVNVEKEYDVHKYIAKRAALGLKMI